MNRFVTSGMIFNCRSAGSEDWKNVCVEAIKLYQAMKTVGGGGFMYVVSAITDRGQAGGTGGTSNKCQCG